MSKEDLICKIIKGCETMIDEDIIFLSATTANLFILVVWAVWGGVRAINGIGSSLINIMIYVPILTAAIATFILLDSYELEPQKEQDNHE